MITLTESIRSELISPWWEWHVSVADFGCGRDAHDRSPKHIRTSYAFVRLLAALHFAVVLPVPRISVWPKYVPRALIWHATNVECHFRAAISHRKWTSLRSFTDVFCWFYLRFELVTVNDPRMRRQWYDNIVLSYLSTRAPLLAISGTVLTATEQSLPSTHYITNRKHGFVFNHCGLNSVWFFKVYFWSDILHS